MKLILLILIFTLLHYSISYGVHIFDDESIYTDEMLVRAKEYHSHGLNLAMNNQYEESLSLLRASLRNNPNATYTLNDLGVTEMRTGDLQRAKRRFWRCLIIEPDNIDCLRNLDDLRRYMDISDYNEGILNEYPQLHIINKPNEIDAIKLMNIERNSLEGKNLLKEPFIVRNALQKWGWDITKFQVNNLLIDYSNAEVDFYPQSMRDEHVHPYFAKFYECINWIHDPIGTYPRVDASEEGTYIQWNLNINNWNNLLLKSGINEPLPPLFNDKWWINQCFSNDDMKSLALTLVHWRMLIVGEKYSGMFNHKDYLPTASFQAQLEGSKKWHLCAPTQDQYMYHAADINTFLPDYNTWPNFQKASCLQTIVYPGDVIYYPDDYWHQTLNLETYTTTIGNSIIKESNYLKIKKLLQLECMGKKALFAPDEQLCKEWEECFIIWDNEYNNNNNNKNENEDEEVVEKVIEIDIE